MTSCFKGRFKVTSIRGYRTIGGSKEYHGGLDLVALDDKNVYAIADGTVDAAPYEPNGFGYYVRQLLPDGRRIYYGHMAKGSVAVKKGDRIKKGDKLGTMGSTGRSTGAHTHLEIRPKGTSKTSLDISEFTGIPNKIGTYECDKEVRSMTAEEKHTYAVKCACDVEDKCGLSKDTVKWLWTYRFSEDLFIKLAEHIK